MRRRITVMTVTAVVVLASTVMVGAFAVPGLLDKSARPGPQDPTINTAAQKSVGNSGAFIDVADDPVSFPAEKTIYPPRTGNAGLLPGGDRPPYLVLLTATLALLGGARLLTRAALPQ